MTSDRSWPEFIHRFTSTSGGGAQGVDSGGEFIKRRGERDKAPASLVAAFYVAVYQRVLPALNPAAQFLARGWQLEQSSRNVPVS